MKRIISLIILICIVIIVTACTNNNGQIPVDTHYPDSDLSLNEKLDWWIEHLTIEEKAGQMVQGERSNNGGVTGVTPALARSLNLGSVLNGGGNTPAMNNINNWRIMYDNMVNASLESSSRIPIIYGIDAVHGHNNVYGATIFPHNIGLAAANNPELMKAIGEQTAYEVAQSGMTMNFSPSIGLIRDKRWGRTYETLGENPEVASDLIGPFIEGIQSFNIAGSTKHFIGDGYTVFGTGLDNKLDRGNAIISQHDLDTIHYPLYEAAIEAGTKTIMISYSSLNSVKMHENKDLVTDVLKESMGFEGFVIGDYNAIDEIDAPSFNQKVYKAINAGIDMLMQPHNFAIVINAIITGANNGQIPMARINDAVRRIVKVKYEIGLFDESEVVAVDLRNETSLEVARQAVRESLVLLKNEGNILPLNKDMNILLVGTGRDNIGIQSGGWTISWQGSDTLSIPGTTIKEALELETNATIYTDPLDIDKVDVVIAVFAEKPHAEMMGDSLALSLVSDTAYTSNQDTIDFIKSIDKPVIGLMIAGKPLIIEDVIDDLDGFVMLFLPGTEGLGITDVLYGNYNFRGKLPFTWPKTHNEAHHTMLDTNYDANLYRFRYGFGLQYDR